MSTEANKTIVRRLFDEAASQGRFDIIDAAMAANVVYTTSALPEYRGPEGFKQFIRDHRGAAPDLHYDLHALVAEGDQVVVHWTAHGTQTGPLLGIPPTGKRFSTTGISLFHFDQGQIDRGQTVWDVLGALQQLGVLPAPQPASA